MNVYELHRAVLRQLTQYPEGLTCHQLSALTGYTIHTCRQAVYELRKAGYRVGADRVFRLRATAATAGMEHDLQR